MGVVSYESRYEYSQQAPAKPTTMNYLVAHCYEIHIVVVTIT